MDFYMFPLLIFNYPFLIHPFLILSMRLRLKEKEINPFVIENFYTKSASGKRNGNPGLLNEKYQKQKVNEIKKDQKTKSNQKRSKKSKKPKKQGTLKTKIS